MGKPILNIRKVVENEVVRVTRKISNADITETVTRCLICGAFVPSTESYYPTPKVCDKCKTAVLKVRKEMEWESLAESIRSSNAKIKNV